VSTMTKVFVVLTAVLSIIASVLFVSAAAQWKNWRQIAEVSQTEKSAAVVERDQMAATMAAVLAMKNDTLRSRDEIIADQRAQLESLGAAQGEVQTQLAEAQTQRTLSEAGRTKLQEILGVVSAELSALQKRTETLLEQNITYQSRIAALNERVLELTADTTILTEQNRNLQARLVASQRQLSNLRERLPADGEGGSTDGGVTPAVAGPLRGEITDVADRYASINIGRGSGVTPEMVFMVYRGSDFLGELVVTRVNPETAGGRLRTLQGQVRAGDLVAYEAR
jgi:hypothetical protein